MRIARYLAGGRETVGIVDRDRVVDVAELEVDAPADVVAILEQGPPIWRRLQESAALREGRPLESIELLAPIARPPKFLAVGFNSHDHLEEALAARTRPELASMFRSHELVQQAFPAPRFPAVFNKQTNAVAGPNEPIWIPRDSSQIDYEGEVAVVIGRRVRRADEREAQAAIAGWTVTNDVSVRDWQWNTSQVWLGKSFDTHGPIGPWIVTADEFDPAAAVIRTWVNDELRQEGRLAEQTLSPVQIVAQLSQICTLEPGDLIATGTPAGIGAVSGRYLVRGDRVRVCVTGIGEIDNEVVDEPVVAL
jgi:2-keto-4-pentenoate hydratase/2-oxohepta-3-ene-1,7-dioic acid hydratase in catechol pathway